MVSLEETRHALASGGPRSACRVGGGRPGGVCGGGGGAGFSDMSPLQRHGGAAEALVSDQAEEGSGPVRADLTRKQTAALLASRAPGQEVAEESRPDHAVPMTARRRIQ